MRLSIVVPVLSVLAFAIGAPSAFAFQAVTNDQFDGTLSTKLSDPDDIVQNMSQQYTGNSATIMHIGNTTVGIIGPNRSYDSGDGPFLADPAAGTVPSKRQW